MKADLNIRTGRYNNVEIERMVASRATLYSVQLTRSKLVIKVYNVENKSEQQRAQYLNKHLLPRLRKLASREKFVERTLLKNFPLDFGSITIDDESYPCTIYNYIPGFDLYSRTEMKHSLIDLDKSSIKFEEFIRIAYELSSTVYILHKMNVIHGDLAPTNIRLNCDNNRLELTLMDLDGSGFIKTAENDWKDLSPLVKGTSGIPGFGPPAEFFKNVEGPSMQTDYWYLAMLLFHIITRGYTPFYFLKYADLDNKELVNGLSSIKNQRWPPSKKDIEMYLPASTINNDISPELLDTHEKLLSRIFGNSAIFYNTFAKGYDVANIRTSSKYFTQQLWKICKKHNI